MHGVGVIGSCRCTTSNARARARRRIRKNERGLRMMFGSVPFAGTITERPIGITSGGGSPWRPCRGWSTRVNWPGGSLPMIVFTSWPSALQRFRLELGVLDDAAPEGPRVRDDDPDLHRRHYRRRAGAPPLPTRPRDPPARAAGARRARGGAALRARRHGDRRPSRAAAARRARARRDRARRRVHDLQLPDVRDDGGRRARVGRRAARAGGAARGAGALGRRSRSASRCSSCCEAVGGAAAARRSARTGARATSRSSTSGSARSACPPRSSRSPARATCAASRTCAARSRSSSPRTSRTSCSSCSSSTASTGASPARRRERRSRRRGWASRSSSSCCARTPSRSGRACARCGRCCASAGRSSCARRRCYASFLVAASVCARMGDAQLGAHQIALQLFFFLALVLDAVAIAGQVIVGRMLGGGDADGAYARGAADDRRGRSSSAPCFAVVLAAARRTSLPRAFTRRPRGAAPGGAALAVLRADAAARRRGVRARRDPDRRERHART